MSAKDKIENAAQAMSETASSWEERCFSIMSALDLDFGGFSTEIPDEGSWYAVNHRKSQEKIHELILENYNLTLENEKIRGLPGDRKTAYLVQHINSDGEDMDLFVFAVTPTGAAKGWATHYELHDDIVMGAPLTKRPDCEFIRIIPCPTSFDTVCGAVTWESILQTFIPVEYV